MKRVIGALALILASCTPTAEQDDHRARCGLLEGPSCRKSVYCGPLGFVDCGSPTDGPAYYFERESGKITGYCGGYCMMQGEQCKTSCPPPQWTCKR
jgi:hypothetical protein